MVIVKKNPTVTAHVAVQVRSKAVLAVGIKENKCERTADWSITFLSPLGVFFVT